MNPTMSLAQRERKYEPCPQSWKIIKIRTKKPPAKIASGTTSHHDTASARYIKYQSSAYGTNVLTICQMARGNDGCWYSATTAFHAATLLPLSFKSDIF